MSRAISKKKLNKKIFYIVCACVFALGLLVSILTLAFFSSKDEVTNKISAEDIKISLIEPEWDDHGKADAAKMQPGMVIDKDPQVKNRSKSAVYIRMKITVKIENQEINESDERYRKIMSALYFSDGENIDPKFTKDGDWYYYRTDDNMTALEAGATSPALFKCIKTPVLKTDYNDCFGAGFSVSVEAQAIPANTDASDFASIKAQFESDYENAS